VVEDHHEAPAAPSHTHDPPGPTTDPPPHQHHTTRHPDTFVQTRPSERAVENGRRDTNNTCNNNNNTNNNNTNNNTNTNTNNNNKVSTTSAAAAAAAAGGGGAAAASLSISKRDLLNQMVTQTKQHRQQIRCLESEVERLRAGDALSRCEVNPGEVEWRPGDVVGEGSFSTVYRGGFCGTEVAVKELKFKLSQVRDDKNYFRSEAALLQQLHHPRVVLLMGVCTAATRPFMVLEYLSGGTLYSLVHDPARDGLDHAAYFVVAKDVAQGMNYLHKHQPQVLHLDLKSMNVLLDSYYRAKIADFGFSILRRSRAGSPAQRGSIRGTPAWMAPELLTKGDVSSKCDVYSYAIILWEMLTASHPFKGLDIFKIMETIEAGGRPPLPSSGVSPELKELITSCWAQNPSLRPSFEEILGALDSAAVPVSWRGVLHRANIPPSLLSDVVTARTIIDVVEQSVELVRRSLQLQRASKNSSKEGKKHKQNSVQLESVDTVRLQPVTNTDNILYKGGVGTRGQQRGEERSGGHRSPTRRPSPSKQPHHTRDLASINGSPVRSPRKSIPKDDGLYYSPDSHVGHQYSESGRPRQGREVRNRSADQQWRSRRGDGEEYIKESRKGGHSEGKERQHGDSRRSSQEGRDRINKVKEERVQGERRKERNRLIRDALYENPMKKKGDHIYNKKSRHQVKQSTNDYDIYSNTKHHGTRSVSLEGRKVKETRATRSSRNQQQQLSNYERRVSSNDRHGGDVRRDGHHGNNFHKERQVLQPEERKKRGGRRNDKCDHLTDSRDSLGDSRDESWTSLEGSTGASSNNGYDDPIESAGEREDRRFTSPRRRSPERRYASPVRQSEHHYHYHHSPERRQASRSPSRRHQTRSPHRSPHRRSRVRTPEKHRGESGSRVGPIVTSEQLKTQKQRLRPVRPAALSDLTHIPENSLNDISLILKTAMIKRRDALDEGLTGTFRSEELEWSDWH
ncbi:hypothetical protein Pmani_030011, partial [Petrolisthes manimaculis]